VSRLTVIGIGPGVTHLDEYRSDFRMQYMVPVLTRISHMKDATNCPDTVRTTVRRSAVLAPPRLTVVRRFKKAE
jgi:hypothetical protein